MQIVGIERTECEGVETIDVWYSERRRAWIVERLDAEGNQVGAAYCCESEAEAAVCLAEWMRAHQETRLVAPRQASAAEKRILTGHPRRQAA